MIQVLLQLLKVKLIEILLLTFIVDCLNAFDCFKVLRLQVSSHQC